MQHPLFMQPALYNYLLQISLREHPVLQALREKNATLPLGIMQVAPDEAQFLQFLVSILQAKNILELGTFTGYSALSMALALPEDGKIITCDRNAEWIAIAKPFWENANVHSKIEVRLGLALETVENLLEQGYAEQFDFLFIDADKTNYLAYYEYALQLIKKSGVIAIDNIFWDGKVLDPTVDDAQTKAIRALNEHIQKDTRVEISLVGIGDGLFLIRRKE
jgi:predicted O-methyltransferase YrrM